MKTGVKPVVMQEAPTYLLHVYLFVICFLCSVLGGAVSTLMSVYLPDVVREIVGQRSADQLNNIGAYINAVFIFGWAFGGFLWGLISDRSGRKISLLLAIACYGMATILTGMVTGWVSIVILRFISGFGVGGVLVISFTILSEIWPVRSRAIFIGILSIGIPVGIFSAGMINNLVSSWREGFLIGYIPLALSLLGLILFKESDLKTDQHTAKQGISTLFSGMYRKDLLMGSVIFGTMLIGLWAIFSWLPTWIQTIVTNENAQRARGFSMMLMGIGGLTGGFLSGWFSKLIGVRKAMITCFSVCALLSAILFKTNSTISQLVFAEIAILAFFFGISQGVLSGYIPQLFPVSQRATATGFCFNVGRIFTGTAVLFLGVLESSLGGYGNAIFTFSLVFFVGLLCVLFWKPVKPNS